MSSVKIGVLALAMVLSSWAQGVTVSVTPASPVAGQPATLRAVVNSSGPGTVSFMDGMTELGKSNVDATGTATLLTNFGSAGRHNLRAIYAPAGSLVRAVSATTPILVTVTAPTKFDRMVSLPVRPSAVLDINRDGILDLLGGIPDWVTFYTPDITVHLGMGGGSFGPAIKSNLTNATGPVGDFNGDGKVDIVATGGFYKGNGDGSFATALTASPNVFDGVAADGDFNGIVDLAGGKTTRGVLGCSAPNAPVTSALNNGAGQFVEMYTAPAALAYVGRLNQDNVVDFVSFGWEWTGRCPLGFITGCTLHKSGVGGYSTSPCTDEKLFGSAKVADLNGDGFDDVVSRSSNNLLVLMNDGAGNFAKFPMSDSANDSPSELIAYDWNADGKMDLVNFWVRLGNGGGTFGPKISIPGALPGIPIELTGDGRTDLITQECQLTGCTPVLLIGADATSAAAPTIIAFSPNAGVQPAGKIVDFTATLQDPAGAHNVKALEVVFNGPQPCFIKVNVASNFLGSVRKVHSGRD